MQVRALPTEKDADINRRIKIAEKQRHPPTAAWPPGLEHHGDLHMPKKHGFPVHKSSSLPHAKIFTSADSASNWIKAEAHKAVQEQRKPDRSRALHSAPALAKHLKVAHKLNANEVSNMSNFMKKQFKTIEDVGTLATTGKMPRKRTTHQHSIEQNAKEVHKIIAQMSTARSLSKSHSGK